MNKMNPEVKKQWVAALRSGEYKQCRGALKKDGGFCCLGVLREIGPPEVRKSQAPPGNAGTLSKKAQEWSGINSDNPDIAHRVSAIDANDQRKWTFNQIADAIEENL